MLWLTPSLMLAPIIRLDPHLTWRDWIATYALPSLLLLLVAGGCRDGWLWRPKAGRSRRKISWS